MSITVEEKNRLIKEYATKEGDTGSPEVQVCDPVLADCHADRTFQDPQQG